MATYTSNYAWTKPEGSDPVDITVLNNNLDSQDNIVHNAYMQFAPVFSTAQTYAVGDVVLYANNLYKCITAVTVAGAWDAAKWTQVKVSDICGGGGGGGTSDYSQLTNKPSINSVTLVGNKTGTQLGLQNTGEASVGVEELIRDTVGRVGKNLMVYPYYEGTEEEQGVTFTDNGDGTITLSGTSSASAYHFIERDSSLFLEAGDYILSGGILNAWLYLYTNSGTEITHTTNSDTSVKVTIPSDGYYRVSLVIPASKTFSDVTCYPMIRRAEVVDDTYESYYPPIEDEIEKLKIQLSVMPTASATYVGKIVQFVGTTDATYTHGYYYECTNNGGTYSWTQLNVQPSSGSGGGHTIVNGAGTSMTQRDALQFTGGLAVSDDSTNERTVVSDEYEIILWEDWQTIVANHEENLHPNAVITGVPGANGDISVDLMTKLWENPSPTASFAAQNITLSSSDYDLLLLVCKLSDTYNGTTSCISPKGMGGKWDLASYASNGPLNWIRFTEYVSDTIINIHDAYTVISGQTGTVDNSRLIPYQIYGIKTTASVKINAVAMDVKASVEYSTSERLIGKWIDGSTLYEKTIDFGALPNNTRKTVNHNISNLGTIVDAKGWGNDTTNAQYYPIPFATNTALTNNIQMFVDNTKITIDTGANRTSINGYITLRYTKNS